MGSELSFSDQQIAQMLEHLSDALVAARNGGKIRSFIGLHGHVALMHDKLQRWFSESVAERRVDEMEALAVDAIVAFMMAMADYGIPDIEIVECLREIEVENEERASRMRALTDDE